MTEPRLTLDDLCGVDGHPAARHDCHAIDRALGIVRCPVRADEWHDLTAPVIRDRIDGYPPWRCHADTRPYENHPLMLVCDRGHVIHPQETENADREDERLRAQARQYEAEAAGVAACVRSMVVEPALPDPGKPPRRTPLGGPLVVTGGGHYLFARFAVLLANIMIWFVASAERLARRVWRDHELVVWLTGMVVLLAAARPGSRPPAWEWRGWGGVPCSCSGAATCRSGSGARLAASAGTAPDAAPPAGEDGRHPPLRGPDPGPGEARRGGGGDRVGCGPGRHRRAPRQPR